MYKAIASVGTLLLNLGELSAEIPETNLENPSTPVLANSSNRTKPVNCSGNSSSDMKDTSNFGEGLDQGSNNGSPLSDTGSAQRRLCEALADAAADCAPGSDEGNTNDEEFIRVGSDDSLLSSPEVIDLDDETRCNTEISSKTKNPDQTTSDCDLAKVSEAFTKNHEGCTKASDHDTKDSDHGTKDSDLSTKVSSHSTKDSEDITEAAENPRNHQEILADSSECVGKGEQPTRRRSSGNVDPYWCITFEQFLASVLTEPLLVEYFEEQTNIEEVINTVKTEGVRDFVRDPRRSISVE